MLYNAPYAKTQVEPELFGWLSVFVAGHTLASGRRLGASGSYSNVAALSPAGAPHRWVDEGLVPRPENAVPELLPPRVEPEHGRVAVDAEHATRPGHGELTDPIDLAMPLRKQNPRGITVTPGATQPAPGRPGAQPGRDIADVRDGEIVTPAPHRKPFDRVARAAIQPGARTRIRWPAARPREIMVKPPGEVAALLTTGYRVGAWDRTSTMTMASMLADVSDGCKCICNCFDKNLCSERVKCRPRCGRGASNNRGCAVVSRGAGRATGLQRTK